MAYNKDVVRFEWDPDKADANLTKHGVSFEQASELFMSGVDFLEIFDEAHSVVEERFLAIGPIRSGVVLGSGLKSKRARCASLVRAWRIAASGRCITRIWRQDD